MPHVKITVRVPFFDVDSSQRIHYTAMMRYMEIAEHALMRSIGFSYATALPGLAFPRIEVACEYLGAIRYDDQLTLTACVGHVGNSSWRVNFTARALPGPETGEEGAILARGHMTMVVMDPQTERSRPIPEELRRALSDASEENHSEKPEEGDPQAM